MSEYVFDPDDGLNDEHVTCLAEVLDSATFASLNLLGVQAGWRCLEVGGGAGSVAAWLRRRVGEQGHITVTDIDTSHLESVPELDCANVTIARHDVRYDPLPVDTFDLVHSRLVLGHLDEREVVLETLTKSLRPGGWIVLDEFETVLPPVVMQTPGPAEEALYRRVIARITDIIKHAGMDHEWGHRVYGCLIDLGMEEVMAEGAFRACPGGTAGMRLHHVVTRRLERVLLSAGLTSEELVDFRRIVMKPEFVATSYPVISTRARKRCRG
ncbi:class I SAM-dependent methyltransferase [Nocardia sp. NPDC046473]|uniref:class I SAM-dependent methyltransferase n=1 Tax=Nocardia sp. NPDC046473 TaxID=3155733 RepID=UPI0033E12D45